MRQLFNAVLVSGILLSTGALAADVSFAIKASAGTSQAAFSYIKAAGGLPQAKVVKKQSVVDGVSYYVWKTSIRGIAHVCAVVDSPTASSKCVGVFGKQLAVDTDFVVLN